MSDLDEVAEQSLNLLDVVLGTFLHDPWDGRYRSQWVAEPVLTAWRERSAELRRAQQRAPR